MKIEVKDLERFGAENADIELFKTKYPDGVEVIEIFKDTEFSIAFFHFIYTYFSLSEREKEKYREICEVKNSTFILNSYKIEDSSYIFRSKNIRKSNYVVNSTDVEFGKSVVDSSDIYQSKDIYSSHHIASSERIIDSTNIKNSFNIVNSKDITWGNCTIVSSNINEGSFLYGCRELISSDFCGFTSNSENCLFCYGAQGARNQIFNQDVGAAEFSRIKEELMYRLEMENPTFVTIDEKVLPLLPKDRFIYSSRFDTVFNGLSDEFYGWISTIPQYNEDIFINLFFTLK